VLEVGKKEVMVFANPISSLNKKNYCILKKRMRVSLLIPTLCVMKSLGIKKKMMSR
jgi:hypothetical protein